MVWVSIFFMLRAVKTRSTEAKEVDMIRISMVFSPLESSGNCNFNNSLMAYMKSLNSSCLCRYHAGLVSSRE